MSVAEEPIGKRLTMDRKGARPIAWFRFTGKSLGWLWSLPSHLYCTKGI